MTETLAPIIEAPVETPALDLTLTPQDVCALAADLLEEHGWCQGMSRTPAGEHCVSGALHEISHSQLSDCCRHCCRMYTDAVRLVQMTINRVDVPAWNDTSCRTKEEAVDALRRASRLHPAVYR